MVAISRPNRDALAKAIDIFRDEMRPFLIESLRQTPGLKAEEAIRQSLQLEHQTIDFDRNLKQNRTWKVGNRCKSVPAPSRT